MAPVVTMDRRVLLFFLGSCLTFVAVTKAQTADNFHPPLAVLHCERARGVITQERAVQALWYAADEMKLPTKELPRILVVHGSADAARLMNLPVEMEGAAGGDSGGVAIYGAEDGGRVYYLWMVTDNVDLWLARGMVNILARHTGKDQSAQGDHVRRVLRRLNATVTTAAIQNGRNPSCR